jgi:hypothetical protein
VANTATSQTTDIFCWITLYTAANVLIKEIICVTFKVISGVNITIFKSGMCRRAVWLVVPTFPGWRGNHLFRIRRREEVTDFLPDGSLFRCASLALLHKIVVQWTVCTVTLCWRFCEHRRFSWIRCPSFQGDWSQWPRGLWPLASWHCGFESRRGHGCLFWVSCVFK